MISGVGRYFHGVWVEHIGRGVFLYRYLPIYFWGGRREAALSVVFGGLCIHE
jgi:hypothetical protein